MAGWLTFLATIPQREQHRLTLNPVRHLDPVGSVLCLSCWYPALSRLWIRQASSCKSETTSQSAQADALVALAGPAVNIVLSAIGFVATEFAIHSSLSYNVELFFIAFGLCTWCSPSSISCRSHLWMVRRSSSVSFPIVTCLATTTFELERCPSFSLFSSLTFSSSTSERICCPT